MLKNHVEQEKPQEEELLRRLEDARNHLFALQMQIKERALPVLVLMEGWGAAGKEVRSVKSSGILIPVSLRWRPCPRLRKKN